MTIRAAQTNNKSVVATNIVIYKTPTITFDKMLQLTCKQADHLGFAFRHRKDSKPRTLELRLCALGNTP